MVLKGFSADAPHIVKSPFLCDDLDELVQGLVRDPEYLYKKIAFLFPDIGYDAFLQCFLEMSRPELVHDLKANSRAESSGTRDEAPAEEPPIDPLAHTSDAVLPAEAKGDVPDFCEEWRDGWDQKGKAAKDYARRADKNPKPTEK